MVTQSTMMPLQYQPYVPQTSQMTGVPMLVYINQVQPTAPANTSFFLPTSSMPMAQPFAMPMPSQPMTQPMVVAPMSQPMVAAR